MPAEYETLNERVERPHVVDGETHPKFFESSWPLPSGDTKVWGKRNEDRYPHIRPGSVLIGIIGNMWVEHAWHRFQDMVLHAEQESNLTVAVQEIPDWSVLPGDAMSNMRIAATMMAMDAGVEWLLLLENDVLLEPDTLERLIARDVPIVAPLLIGPDGKILKITSQLKRNTGLQRVRSTVLSIALFDVKVFNATGAGVWGYGSGSEEAVAWMDFNHYGHRLFIDTDTIVNIARGPSYPGNLEWDELQRNQKDAWERYRYLRRDRRPPPDYDPVWTNDAPVTNGVYRPLDGPNRRRVNVNGR